jgi:replicative DNA helicase/TusA-related sulfurtransferase
MENNLTDEYVIELFNCAFKNNNFFEVLTEHLKYSYLTHEHEKKLWKKALQLYTLNGKIPSIGVLQIEFRKDEKVKDLIYEVKSLDEVDQNATIEAFQDFIKESKFVELFQSSGELYNRGEQSKAYSAFIKGAEDLAKFSIKERLFDKVFEDFESRQIERMLDDSPRRKVPFCIEQLDDASRGGPETGESVLLMAESGMGKSQFLVHYAVQTSRRGSKVALFQIEGTKAQVMNRLDASWTGALYHDIKKGEIEDERYKKIKSVLKKMRGEIFVEAYEKFGGATINDIRRSVKDLKKIHGDELDLVCIDYLELIELGDGVIYGPTNERHRQQKIGRYLKEIAMEFDVVVATVTQASNLPSELKKDINFVMTREFLSEDKGKIRPFDFFFTLNQSYDEMKFLDRKGDSCPRVRIFIDKMREYASGQTIKLITNYSRSRFYDRKKTIEYIIDFEDEDGE